MKYLIILLFILVSCDTIEAPANKRGKVELVLEDGGKDTVTIEYYKYLRIYTRDLVDANGNIEALGVKRFSFLSDSINKKPTK